MARALQLLILLPAVFGLVMSQGDPTTTMAATTAPGTGTRANTTAPGITSMSTAGASVCWSEANCVKSPCAAKIKQKCDPSSNGTCVYDRTNLVAVDKVDLRCATAEDLRTNCAAGCSSTVFKSCYRCCRSDLCNTNSAGVAQAAMALITSSLLVSVLGFF